MLKPIIIFFVRTFRALDLRKLAWRWLQCGRNM